MTSAATNATSSQKQSGDNLKIFMSSMEPNTTFLYQARSKTVLSYATTAKSLQELVKVIFYESSQLGNPGYNKKVKVRPSKGLLSQLREISLFLRPQLPVHEDLAYCLITLIRECSDSDVDRKIIRYAIFLLVEMIKNDNNYAHTTITSNLIKLYGEYSNTIALEIREQRNTIGLRLCLAWKSIGRGLSKTNPKTSVVLDMCSRALQDLTYPEKPKQSILGNKKVDREYEYMLILWNSILSSLRKINMVLPISTNTNITKALINSIGNSTHTGIVEMIQTHSIAILHTNMIHTYESKGDLSPYISILSQYLKKYKAQRSGIGSFANKDSKDNSAINSNNMNSNNIEIFSGIFRILKYLSNTSNKSHSQNYSNGNSNFVSDEICIELYESLWHLIAGIVILSDNNESNLKTVRRDSNTVSSMSTLSNELLSLDGTKVFCDMIQYYLEHDRVTKLLQNMSTHTMANTNLSNINSSNNGSSNTDNTNGIDSKSNAFIGLIVKSLAMRLVASANTMNILNSSTGNNGTNSHVNSSVILVLPMLLRAAARFGKWVHRERIIGIDSTQFHSLRDILIRLVRESKQYNYSYTSILYNNVSATNSTNSNNTNVNVNHKSMGRHIYILTLESIIWLFPSYGTSITSKYSMNKYIIDFYDDIHIDCSLRIQILSQLVYRCLAIQPNISKKSTSKRYVNPISVSSILDLAMNCMWKYPSDATSSLIQFIWTHIIHLIHETSYNNSNNNNSISNVKLSADMIARLRSELYGSLMATRDMDLSQATIITETIIDTVNSSKYEREVEIALHSIRNLQKAASYFLSDEICLWLRDDLGEYSLPISKTKISIPISSLSSATNSVTANLISNLSIDQDYDHDNDHRIASTSSQSISQNNKKEENMGRNSKPFVIVTPTFTSLSNNSVNNSNNNNNSNSNNSTTVISIQTSPSELLHIPGRVPKRIMSILAYLIKGLHSLGCYSEEDSNHIRGLIRATARFCEAAIDITAAALLRDYLIDLLQNHIDQMKELCTISTNSVNFMNSKPKFLSFAQRNLLIEIENSVAVFKQSIKSSAVIGNKGSAIELNLLIRKKEYKLRSVTHGEVFMSIDVDTDRESELGMNEFTVNGSNDLLGLEIDRTSTSHSRNRLSTTSTLTSASTSVPKKPSVSESLDFLDTLSTPTKPISLPPPHATNHISGSTNTKSATRTGGNANSIIDDLLNFTPSATASKVITSIPPVVSTIPIQPASPIKSTSTFTSNQSQSQPFSSPFDSFNTTGIEDIHGNNKQDMTFNVTKGSDFPSSSFSDTNIDTENSSTSKLGTPIKTTNTNAFEVLNTPNPFDIYLPNISIVNTNDNNTATTMTATNSNSFSPFPSDVFGSPSISTSNTINGFNTNANMNTSFGSSPFSSSFSSSASSSSAFGSVISSFPSDDPFGSSITQKRPTSDQIGIPGPIGSNWTNTNTNTSARTSITLTTGATAANSSFGSLSDAFSSSFSADVFGSPSALFFDNHHGQNIANHNHNSNNIASLSNTRSNSNNSSNAIGNRNSQGFGIVGGSLGFDAFDTSSVSSSNTGTQSSSRTSPSTTPSVPTIVPILPAPPVASHNSKNLSKLPAPVAGTGASRRGTGNSKNSNSTVHPDLLDLK